jgi:hypothetical protein
MLVPLGHVQKRVDAVATAPTSFASFRAAWFIAAVSPLVTVLCAPDCAPARAAFDTAIAV